MLRTITIGTAISVQGVFVRSHMDGRISVRVGKAVFSGYPVQKAAA